MTNTFFALIGLIAGFILSGYLDTQEELRQRTAYEGLLTQAYAHCPDQ